MLKVIARLRDIPNGATVTKVGGNKKHYVWRKIAFHNGVTGRQGEILADESCAFLADGSGRFNAHHMDKEVVWHTSLEELNDLDLGGISETGDPL
jgi:hypothetical protein